MDASLDRIAVPAGTLLFAEGDAGSSAYLIDSGRIEIFLLREGREVILATRGPGEIVGEMAIIDSRPRSASARVVADCELVIITAEQIAHRIAQTDPILRMCLGVVIARYREMVAMIDQGDRRQIAAAPTRRLRRANSRPRSARFRWRASFGARCKRDEFELFFQPIVRLPSRRLAGFEALLRWRHPTRGLIAPGEFIPIAEASGLIVEITDWCLDAGRAHISRHRQGGAAQCRRGRSALHVGQYFWPRSGARIVRRIGGRDAGQDSGIEPAQHQARSDRKRADEGSARRRSRRWRLAAGSG